MPKPLALPDGRARGSTAAACLGLQAAAGGTGHESRAGQAQPARTPLCSTSWQQPRRKPALTGDSTANGRASSAIPPSPDCQPPSRTPPLRPSSYIKALLAAPALFTSKAKLSHRDDQARTLRRGTHDDADDANGFWALRPGIGSRLGAWCFGAWGFGCAEGMGEGSFCVQKQVQDLLLHVHVRAGIPPRSLVCNALAWPGTCREFGTRTPPLHDEYGKVGVRDHSTEFTFWRTAPMRSFTNRAIMGEIQRYLWASTRGWARDYLWSQLQAIITSNINTNFDLAMDLRGFSRLNALRLMIMSKRTRIWNYDTVHAVAFQIEKSHRSFFLSTACWG
ncbi:hypothetical protein DFH27DRAFT_528572 [Peziza echinospora]|nr:hypothetical protein DFH27DRAFT_528572 [Peziza echinospora]